MTNKQLLNKMKEMTVIIEEFIRGFLIYRKQKNTIDRKKIKKM